MLCSPADQILFGGAVGGGKSDCLIGLALTQKLSMLLLRREFKSLQAIMDRFTELVGRDCWHAGEQTWKLPNGSTVELASAPNVGDEQKFQGRAHDVLALDEAAQFQESQVIFLSTWVRSTNPEVNCRVILTSNPPVGGQGRWLADWFRPWVDPDYPNPARSGEVRAFARIGDLDREVDPQPFEHHGRRIVPLKRTFIRSTLADNEYLSRTGYADRLQHLPDHMREALLNGDFMSAGQDQPLQAIPSAWLKAANDRWQPLESPPALSAIGVDVARGGSDRTVIWCRHQHWLAKPLVLRGSETASGATVAARVLDLLGDSAANVYVDVVGVGASVYDFLEGYIGSAAVPVNGGAKSERTDATGTASFFNLRSEAWWTFRQRLNPETSRLAIPRDNALFAELTTPTYTLSGTGIKLETKEALIKRLGHSPDIADALILACHGQSRVTVL